MHWEISEDAARELEAELAKHQQAPGEEPDHAPAQPDGANVEQMPPRLPAGQT